MMRMMEMHFSSNLVSRGRLALCLPSGFLARRRAAREKTREAKRWRGNNKIALCSSRPLNRTIAINFTRQSRFSEKAEQAGEQLIQMSPWTFQLNAIDHLTWINNSVTSERALSSSAPRCLSWAPKHFLCCMQILDPRKWAAVTAKWERNKTTPRPLKIHNLWTQQIAKVFTFFKWTSVNGKSQQWNKNENPKRAVCM